MSCAGRDVELNLPLGVCSDAFYIQLCLCLFMLVCLRLCVCVCLPHTTNNTVVAMERAMSRMYTEVRTHTHSAVMLHMKGVSNGILVRPV